MVVQSTPQREAHDAMSWNNANSDLNGAEYISFFFFLFPFQEGREKLERIGISDLGNRELDGGSLYFSRPVCCLHNLGLSR